MFINVPVLIVFSKLRAHQMYLFYINVGVSNFLLSQQTVQFTQLIPAGVRIHVTSSQADGFIHMYGVIAQYWIMDSYLSVK